MIVKELIEQLQKVDGGSRVFMGYDGDIVITEAKAVEYLAVEKQIGPCWWRAKVGDTVILCAK